jgi:hypothetical protein
MSDIDLSWIDQEERLLSNDLVLREPMKQIKVVYLYINQYDYIEKIVKDVHLLDSSMSISTIALIDMIEHHKMNTTTSKYKMIDSFIYHSDLLPQNIQSYVNQEMETRYFKPVVLTETLQLPPALIFLQEISTLYFIYKESPYSMNATLKPILRSEKRDLVKSKRVRINVSGGNKTKKSIRV